MLEFRMLHVLDTVAQCLFPGNDCKFQWFSVINYLIMSEITKQCLASEETDDNSCRLELVEIVPLTRDTGGPCTTECDSGDWSAEVKQENLPVVKQEPDDVCRIV